LIHELFDGNNLQILEIRKKILQNAKAIIAVSENTKEDLVDIYKTINEEKIHVIQHGIEDNDNHSSILHDNCVISKFILYVGHREGYKNFKILLPTLKRINEKTDINLYIVGPKSTTDEEKLISKLNINSKVRFLGKVSDKELDTLYSQCLAFIYPSLYEGFGYPLIESMARGAIPIASNTSSIPEVLGYAGIIVKPNCLDSLMEAILEVTMNSKLKNLLIKKSIQRSKDFNLIKNIKSTQKVYKKCLT
jgi:glycosyltransferase involved in cell wall biosynthesis